jgi:hypothetical protein
MPGTITTYAGTTQGQGGDGGPATNASLSFPYGLALDLDGSLLIADYFGNRVRRVSRATGVITTVIGNDDNAAAGGKFSGDLGPALSASLNQPVGVRELARLQCHSVQCRTRPSCPSSASCPQLAVDAQGNIFVADSTNARIRMVNATTNVGRGSCCSCTMCYTLHGRPAWGQDRGRERSPTHRL